MRKASKIHVRLMIERDLTEVSELVLLANPHAVKEKYKECIASVLKENPDLSFVAVLGGRVIGYVQVQIRGAGAVIEDIAVKEEFQGKGIGEKLLKKELQALRGKNVRLVFAEVHYKYASAIPFYYRFGFRICGFQQDYFGVGRDAIILRLEL